MEHSNIQESEPCVDEQRINVKVVLEINETRMDFSISDAMIGYSYGKKKLDSSLIHSTDQFPIAERSKFMNAIYYFKNLNYCGA